MNTTCEKLSSELGELVGGMVKKKDLSEIDGMKLSYILMTVALNSFDCTGNSVKKPDIGLIKESIDSTPLFN